MAKDYDPKKVTVTIGAHIVSGFADGTFITAQRNNQMFTLQVGANGEASRSKSNDFGGTVELVLMQTSASNDYLAAQAALDESDLNGGKFTLAILDSNGKTLIGATEAWVQQQPSTEFAKELSERTWILESGNLQMFIGGQE